MKNRSKKKILELQTTNLFILEHDNTFYFVIGVIIYKKYIVTLTYA